MEIACEGTFPLSSAVFTQNLDRGLQFPLKVKAGLTFVNEMTVWDEAHEAFGGERTWGLGHLNGESAIQEFTVPIIGITRPRTSTGASTPSILPTRLSGVDRRELDQLQSDSPTPPGWTRPGGAR